MTSENAGVEVCAAIRNRRSSRSFRSQSVGEGALASLFEAARWAPSSGNGQPWRFVVTRNGSAGFDRLAATLRVSNRWAEQAPVLVLAAVRLQHVHPIKPPKPNRLALLELGLAVGNLLTQATSVGLVAHPLAGFDATAAGEALGVQEGFETAVLIAIGYPDASDDGVPRRDEKPRKRLPTDAFVFHERWGSVKEP